MDEFQEIVKKLITRAREIHTGEEKLAMESVAICGELDRLKAASYLRVSSEKFAEHLGLSINQFWKRCQVARLMRFIPEVRVMLERGETQISHVAMLSAKLTQANKHILLPGIKGKTKREIEYLLSTVTTDGRIIEKEPEVEIKLKLTKSQMALLDRAKEVLAARGQVPTQEQVVVKALEILLEKKDPMAKAKRAEPKLEKELGRPPERPSVGRSPERPSLGKEPQARTAIPAAIRHQIYLRDGGQCTFFYDEGERCSEKGMLELDHITPVIPLCETTA